MGAIVFVGNTRGSFSPAVLLLLQTLTSLVNNSMIRIMREQAAVQRKLVRAESLRSLKRSAQKVTY